MAYSLQWTALNPCLRTLSDASHKNVIRICHLIAGHSFSLNNIEIQGEWNRLIFSVSSVQIELLHQSVPTHAHAGFTKTIPQSHRTHIYHSFEPILKNLIQIEILDSCFVCRLCRVKTSCVMAFVNHFPFSDRSGYSDICSSFGCRNSDWCSKSSSKSSHPIFGCSVSHSRLQSENVLASKMRSKNWIEEIEGISCVRSFYLMTTIFNWIFDFFPLQISLPRADNPTCTRVCLVHVTHFRDMIWHRCNDLRTRNGCQHTFQFIVFPDRVLIRFNYIHEAEAWCMLSKNEYIWNEKLNKKDYCDSSGVQRVLM